MTNRCLKILSLIIGNNQWLIDWLPINYPLISLMSLMSSIRYTWLDNTPTKHSEEKTYLPMVALLFKKAKRSLVCATTNPPQRLKPVIRLNGKVFNGQLVEQEAASSLYSCAGTHGCLGLQPWPWRRLIWLVEILANWINLPFCHCASLASSFVFYTSFLLVLNTYVF